MASANATHRHVFYGFFERVRQKLCRDPTTRMSVAVVNGPIARIVYNEAFCKYSPKLGD